MATDDEAVNPYDDDTEVDAGNSALADAMMDAFKEDADDAGQHADEPDERANPGDSGNPDAGAGAGADDGDGSAGGSPDADPGEGDRTEAQGAEGDEQSADDKGDDQAAGEGDEPKGDDDEDADALEGAPEKTQERFKKLRSDYKEVKQQLEAEQERGQKFAQFIQSFGQGVQPQEFSRLAKFSANLKSGTPDGLQYAAQELQHYGQMIAQALGVPFHGFSMPGQEQQAGYDPLSDYPDLKSKVDNFELTEDQARQEAANRRRQGLENYQRETAQAQQQRQQAFHQLVDVVGQMEQKFAENPQYNQPMFTLPNGESRSMAQLMAAETQRLGTLAMQGQVTLQAVPQMLADYYQSMQMRVAGAQPSQPAQPQGREPQPMVGRGRGAQSTKPEADTLEQAMLNTFDLA